MCKLKEYKLDDVFEIIKDSYSPDKKETLDYIGLEHIEQEALRLNSIGTSNDVTSNKYRFLPNDILFGKLRCYFRKVVKPNFSGICSTDIWVCRAKENFDQNFLFYFLANWDFINTAENGEGGTRMPRADWDFLKNTTWNFPEKTYQIKIAKILSSLDDKIDLLHRQNKTLEQLAETLFRQWFVRRPELVEGEEVEESWVETCLFDSINLFGGGTPRTDKYEYWNGNIKWLSGGDIASNHKSFVESSEKTITEIGLKSCSAKLLPEFSTVISARGTVGKYCLLSEPMTFSQSNYGITPKIENCYFFTYLLIAHSVDELQAASYGSVFDTITTNTFKEHKIKLPKESEIIQFNKSVSPYFKKIKSNIHQIRTLTQLRNTLLSKLMSGEVRVITEN